MTTYTSTDGSGTLTIDARGNGAYTLTEAATLGWESEDAAIRDRERAGIRGNARRYAEEQGRAIEIYSCDGATLDVVATELSGGAA